MRIKHRVVVTAAALGVVTFAIPAFAYDAPVTNPIVDHFRKPPSPYEAGNRGIDYNVKADTPVKASEEGTVTFAGKVGNDAFIVIQHPDGLRTTYGYLYSIKVHSGQHVQRGEVIATGNGNLHFGVRRGIRGSGGEGAEYIDPESLLERGAHLIPPE